MNGPKKLSYEISKYSSYSTSYLPENIREDCPSNQTSRWSSNTNNPPQYLVLRLQRPSVISHIKFGKHEKTHVCNLKKFRVFGGLDDDEKLELLFDGGLKNDSVPETFELRHTDGSGDLMPLVYVKIVPLLSWGPSFNFSIWYVELLGRDDPFYVRDSLRAYNMVRELELVRLCLKHFRQQGYTEAFRALQLETGLRLEADAMTALHDTLVRRGDFEQVERILVDFVNDGLVDQYLAQRDYKAIWTQQQPRTAQPQSIGSPTSMTVACRRPGVRGGHQLVVDAERGLMYLFGGWDGFTDLSDLWSFDMEDGTWTKLHGRAEKQGGPGPRSCHKMLYDPVNQNIFVLGRYLDSSSRTRENLSSDFYLYDTRHGTWLQICEDTAAVGGPRLIFDHQMCIDAESQTIYVFGGRVLTARHAEDAPPVLRENDAQYSGLYSYHIPTNTWRELLVDCEHRTASDPDVLSIKARVTHSMLFHERNRMLYIFGGQRNKEYTPDFLSYHVDTHELAVVPTVNNSTECGNMPQSGFTQRATIDTDRDEIYVLSSLSKEKERRDLNLNSFWIFSLRTSTWTCIYRSDHSAEQCFTKTRNTCTEPCPRYAHQLVYDQRRQQHYLFGGNPGKHTLPQLRLDDFWVLRLEKPTRAQVLRHNLYLIRRLHYEEIAKDDPVRALQFLQTNLSDIIDHTDPVQLKEFHKLTRLLFRPQQPTPPPPSLSAASANPQQAVTAEDLHNGTALSGSSSSSSGYHHHEMDTADTDSEHSMSISPVPPLSAAVEPNHRLGDLTPSDTSSDGTTDTADIAYASSTGGSSIVPSRQQQAKALADAFSGHEVQQRRALLYNKIVSMLPGEMVQPLGRLSDAAGVDADM